MKKIFLKIKKLNKKEKEKILIKVFTAIVLIYFIFSGLNKNSNNKKEEGVKDYSESTIAEDYDEDQKNLGLEETEKIYIHLTGYINNPGVLDMNEGMRLSDAIKEAGGLKDGANIKYLNLAKKLEDGEKIYIPNSEEVKEFEKRNKEQNIGNTDRYIEKEQMIEMDSKENLNSEKNFKVNINSSGREDILKIPGVGDVTANKIIEYRKNKGKFKSLEDIKNIEGIGDVKFQKLKKYISI